MTVVSPLSPVEVVVGVEYVVEGGADDEGELLAEPVLLGTPEDMPLSFRFQAVAASYQVQRDKSQQGLQNHYMMHMIHFIRQTYSNAGTARKGTTHHAVYHAPFHLLNLQKPRSILAICIC
jgi:hypothetical protein